MSLTHLFIGIDSHFTCFSTCNAFSKQINSYLFLPESLEQALLEAEMKLKLSFLVQWTI